MEERDTYKYQLKMGKKVVFRGVTYDLERREAQHQEEFPGSHIHQVGRKTTRDRALKWEREGGGMNHEYQADHAVHDAVLSVFDFKAINERVLRDIEAASAALDALPPLNMSISRFEHKPLATPWDAEIRQAQRDIAANAPRTEAVERYDDNCAKADGFRFAHSLLVLGAPDLTKCPLCDMVISAP